MSPGNILRRFAIDSLAVCESAETIAVEYPHQHYEVVQSYALSADNVVM